MGIFYKRYTEAWRVEFGLEEIFHRMVSKPLPPLTTNHCVSCYVCSFSTALVVQSASRNCRPLLQAPVVRLSIHRLPSVASPADLCTGLAPPLFPNFRRQLVPFPKVPTWLK